MESKIKNDPFISDLADFFDLLAKFDHEDNKQSVLSTVSLVSAPKETVPSTDSKPKKYEKRAEKKTTKR